MPGERLIGAALSTDALRVIDEYLAAFAAQLAAPIQTATEIVDEMRADLTEATLAQMQVESNAVRAAHAALEAFGDAAVIAAALRPEVTVRHSRRIGFTLLATGPLIGMCWVAAVIINHHDLSIWRWLPLVVLPILMIGAPAAVLTVASSGKLCSRWLWTSATFTTGAVAVAGMAAGIGDVLLLFGSVLLVLLKEPAPSPIMVLAAVASAARLAFLVRMTLRWPGVRTVTDQRALRA